MNVKEKAQKLLRKTRRFTICAIDHEGYPIAKAVLPSKIRTSFTDIYFVTNTHSNYVQAIRVNSKAGVYFYDSFLFQGCLLNGEMSIVTDEKIKAALWKSSYNGAYPEPDKTYHDPDFCVLKFIAHKGRYYSMFKTADFTVD